MGNKIRSWISLVLFLVVVIINYLIATGSIYGIEPQKEVSKMYNTTITPAGFAFAIWGVIYVLLFLAILYMLKISYSDVAESHIVREISVPLYFLFIFNIAWNIAFGMRFIDLSFILILGYWISLITICARINYKTTKLNAIFPLAFGLHTGWITIAGVVNFYADLVKHRWEGIGYSQDFWTLVGILVVIILVIFLQVSLKNVFVPFGTAWAIFGIYERSDVSYRTLPFIPTVLIISIIFLFVLSAITFFKNDNSLVSP